MPNIEAKFVPLAEAHTTVLQNRMGGFEFGSHLNMRVIVASNDKGPLVTVSYVQVDDVFLITAMGYDSTSTAEEQRQAANAVDLLLEQQAQLAGVTKLLMLTDQSGTECRELRTYTSQSPSVKSLAPIARAAYSN
jgi:hypothetical protein